MTATLLAAVTAATRAQSHAIGCGHGAEVIDVYDVIVSQAYDAARAAGATAEAMDAASDDGFDLYCQDLGL